MLSITLLKAALFEALQDTPPSSPADLGKGTYQPLGLIGAPSIEFYVTNSVPESAIDLTDNKAQIVIEGPVGGSAYPNSSTLARVNLQLQAIALNEPDAGFLGDYLRAWLSELGSLSMPMQGQTLNQVNVSGIGGTLHVPKRQYWRDVTTATFWVAID